MADYYVRPGHLNGTAQVPPSKSILHRELIAIALTALNRGVSYSDLLPDDIEQTALKAGDDILATLDSLGAITGEKKVICCRESGTTLRLMIPVLAALGRDTEIHIGPGLSARPIGELADELARYGCSLTKTALGEDDPTGPAGGSLIRLSGRLKPGAYSMPGNVSSQYTSGLLMAIPLVNGPCSLTVRGKMGSRPYVDMTLKILEKSGLTFVEREAGRHDGSKLNQDIIFELHGNRTYTLDKCSLEPDWSAAAFWKVAEYIDPQSRIDIPGLLEDSCQGDSSVTKFLSIMEEYRKAEASGNASGADSAKDSCIINLDNTPDLLPALAIAACSGSGRYLFTGIERLKYKESDRIRTVTDMVNGLGGKASCVSASTNETALLVEGVGRLRGNAVNSHLDHRIAMAGAIGVLICDEQMCIIDGQSVSKSYPGFWEDFERLQQSN